MKVFSILAVILLFGTIDFQKNSPGNELFVVITTADAETQMMAMVLATQSVNQDVAVRILLCGEAGNLAIVEYTSPVFAPSNRSPKQLLTGLIERDITVEVCGIFLPNRNFTESDLIPGVTIASPPEVAGYMKQDNVRYFTF
ncbi:MAG: hypothetical protein EA359_05915 [Balneolaceae bacterium]|nr:MAG: hypothetical protein EA359_05915 [Balneolaceae bacterium]